GEKLKAEVYIKGNTKSIEEKIPLTDVAADSREHMLVVYLNDKAKVVPVKAKKHYFVRDYAEQIKPL
ncbi:MAG: hypothetical protein KHW39_07405, partial [Megasphaera micronuciformis]|nr:hypothetical protein [Megasphaera micronuciformis]